MQPTNLPSEYVKDETTTTTTTTTTTIILRAAASKYQTSPDSSKKSTSISFYKKNPYIELFSKIVFKRFIEFHLSRNRAMSDFAQMGLGAKPKIGKFCEC